MSLEDVEALPDQEGAGALRRQREPGRQGARAEPQRAVPAAAALRPVSRLTRCESETRRELPAIHPHSPRRAARRAARHDRRILLLALAPALPGGVVALILLWTGDYTPKVQWTLTVLIVGVWLGCALRAARARRPAAADALEPARGAARRRLLDPRARRARRRSARRGDARGQRARRDAARRSGSARSKRRRCCAR